MTENLLKIDVSLAECTQIETFATRYSRESNRCHFIKT